MIRSQLLVSGVIRLVGPMTLPTRDPTNNDPPASKEWYGKFCVDADRNIWECTATSDGASPPNLVYS